MSSNTFDKLNFLTETIIVQHSRKAYSNKGIAACIKYENNFFLRHLNLKKKRCYRVRLWCLSIILRNKKRKMAE